MADVEIYSGAVPAVVGWSLVKYLLYLPAQWIGNENRIGVRVFLILQIFWVGKGALTVANFHFNSTPGYALWCMMMHYLTASCIIRECVYIEFDCWVKPVGQEHYCFENCILWFVMCVVVMMHCSAVFAAGLVPRSGSWRMREFNQTSPQRREGPPVTIELQWPAQLALSAMVSPGCLYVCLSICVSRRLFWVPRLWLHQLVASLIELSNDYVLCLWENVNFQF